MNSVFVITSSDVLARSLSRYFRYTSCVETFVMRPTMESAGPQHLVIHSFQRIANWIEDKSRSDEGINLRNALVFIDLFDTRLLKFEDLDPMALDKGNWSATVAMLLLSFPEMHWVLNMPYQPPDKQVLKRGHLLGNGNSITRIIELRDAEYTPLFDPAGLRLVIRKQLSNLPEANYVPVRHHVATAIDEEDDYAYFNAYMAYRIGYRCYVISSYLMMQEILWRPVTPPELIGTPASAKSDEHIVLIFEDLYLNFPDHIDPHQHLSNLRERSNKFKALADQELRPQFRTLVTVGHDIKARGKTFRKENEEYEKEWEGLGTRKFGNVLKPVSGFFHLWDQSGIDGYAEDYVWPPLSNGAPPDPEDPSRPRDDSSRTTFYSGHSAPGRLLEVAERLLYRAELNSEHVQTVPEAVYGAMLALDAQEYLGHRTPTTSLQALALKHKFEVSAECLFYGVGTNKEVKKRFDEIEKEISSIGRWLSPETRKAAQLDAEMSIMSKIMLVFRQNYQFDEEQECLKELRNLNRKLWSRKRQAIRSKRIKSWKRPDQALSGLLGWLFHWPIRGGRWYVEQLVNSVALFMCAIAAWVIILSILYGSLCGCTAQGESASRPHISETIFIPVVQKGLYFIEQGLMHAMTAFFGLQPPHNVDQLEQFGPWVVAVTLLAIGLGFVHLGIFVSHVYSVISRR